MHCDVRQPPRRLRLLGVLSSCALVVLLALAPSAYAESYGGIEGKVVDASSRAPIQGIEVCAITSDYELLGEAESEWEHAEGCDKTGAAGEYKISGLTPGSYYVAFFPLPESKLDYIGELYSGALELSAATQVSVTAEKTTQNVEAQLSPGAEISGKVTNAETGAPIGGAFACALRSGAQASLEGVSCASSEADGEYRILGLPSGSYKLGFVAAGFKTGYYDGKLTAAEAEAISLLAPGLTTGINDALTPGSDSLTGLGTTPAGGSTPAAKLPGALTTGSTAPATSILSLLARRLTVAGDGDALVKLACTGSAACRAKLTLSAKRTLTINGRHVTRSVAIGTSPVISIAAGKTRVAYIKLESVVRAFLREHRELHVDMTLATPGRKRAESVVLVEHGAVKRR